LKTKTIFAGKPKRIFLFDGVGALLSAFLLGVVLVNYETFFGIPKETLYFLAIFPILFALYDLYCYFFINKKLKLFITIIAMANLLYCLLSIGFLFKHHTTLTGYGWFYFILEIIVVLLVVDVERHTIRRLI